MDKGVIDTIDELLQGAVDDIDDPETTYKIRSAQQLLNVIEQRHDDVNLLIDDAIADEEVINDLRNLGYLD